LSSGFTRTPKDHLLRFRTARKLHADYDEAAQVKRYDGAHAPELMPPTVPE
jgi:hypothetical protein